MSQTNHEELTEHIEPIANQDSNSGIDQLNFLGSQPDAPYFIENPFKTEKLEKVLKFTQAELARPRNLNFPIQLLVTGLITSAFVIGAFALAYKISTVKPLIRTLANPATHSVDSSK